MKNKIFNLLKTRLIFFPLGFTLIEILVALIILSVLASLSVAAYQKTIDANKDKICQQNLKVLAAAVDIYVLENDSLPATLSKLTPQQIHLAYQKVLGKTDSENKFLAFLSNVFSSKPAMAQCTSNVPFGKYYGNKRDVFLCPADPAYKTKIKNIPTGTITLADTYPSYNFIPTGNLSDVVDTSNCTLRRDSQFPIFQDKGNWHPKSGIPGKHSNAVTPSGDCSGRYDPMGDEVVCED